MKSTRFEKTAEYLLLILLSGLAIFLFREVWESVQVLEGIYNALLEGAIFTEGPPIPGVKQYLLFCLCSGTWFLLAFASLLSRRHNLIYFVQFTFIIMPVWLVFYAFIKASANYVFDSLYSFLIHQFLPSWNLFWFILTIAVAIFGVRYCRLIRRASA